MTSKQITKDSELVRKLRKEAIRIADLAQEAGLSARRRASFTQRARLLRHAAIRIEELSK